MLDKLRYEILPYLKVRLLFWWWVVRYGGVRSIPREVLAERMERNIERMRENLMNALRALPDDATEEERQMVLNAIGKSNEIARLYREGIAQEREHENS